MQIHLADATCVCTVQTHHHKTTEHNRWYTHIELCTFISFHFLAFPAFTHFMLSNCFFFAIRSRFNWWVLCGRDFVSISAYACVYRVSRQNCVLTIYDGRKHWHIVKIAHTPSSCQTKTVCCRHESQSWIFQLPKCNRCVQQTLAQKFHSSFLCYTHFFCNLLSHRM